MRRLCNERVFFFFKKPSSAQLSAKDVRRVVATTLDFFEKRRRKKVKGSDFRPISATVSCDRGVQSISSASESLSEAYLAD